MTTRKAFHEELDEITGGVVRLAVLAGEAVQRGSEAFLAGNLAGAEAVIAGDRELDELTWSIERRAFQLQARQQPMARDLRTLVTVMRVIHELERVGDNVVNIAKTTRRLFPTELDPKVCDILQRMKDQAVLQLKVAAEAFAERDPARAAALADMDDVMDDLQKQLFRSVFGMQADEDSIQR